MTASPPQNFENPRGDDAWDNDAVQWLLTQPGSEGWTRGTLMEALRRQPRWLRDRPDRVEAAAALARRHGVEQREEARRAGWIVRLVRTDPDAPEYPSHRWRPG